MAKIRCSLPTDIIYFQFPAEKGNIQIGIVEFAIMVLALYLHRAPSAYILPH